MAKRKNNKQNIQAGLILGGLIGMEKWADVVAQRASSNAPVASSRLATSIIKDPKGAQIERDVSTITFTHRVGTNVEYAGAQEMGSGLYNEWEGDEARPKRAYAIVAGALQDPPLPGGKKALAFHWKDAPAGMKPTGKDGKFIFTYVMHPGVRPKRYLRNALRDTRDEGKELVRSNILQQIASLMK